MDLIWMRAAALVRRGWRSTVLLAILAGLAAGIAMAVVGAGRRTATAFDRFAAFADVAELLVNVCPPGHEVRSEEDLLPCQIYDAAAERDELAALPEVEAVARSQFRTLTVARVSDPRDTTSAVSLLTLDEGIESNLSGDYLVVDGRKARSADEVVLNEALASVSGLGIGDDAVVTFATLPEIEQTGRGMQLSGPAVEVTVVGVGRALTDLAATQSGLGPTDDSVLLGGPGLAAATPEAFGFTGLLVDAAEDDAAAARAAIQNAFGDERMFNIASALGDDEIEPTREAIRYEAQAVTALGLLIAAVSIAFIGQSIARQSRREWSDGPILRAIGVTTREASVAALLRGASIGLPAAVIAASTTVLLSPFGPIGVGRRAETDAGFAIDPLVLVVGLLGVVLVAAAAAWVPLWRGRALRTVRPLAPRQRPSRTPALPPVATAGLHLARTGSRGSGVEVGTALFSVGAAVVCLVAAVCLVASYDDLSSSPQRLGAPWDLSIAVGLGGERDVLPVRTDPELRDSIVRGAGIKGVDMAIGDDQEAWVQAFFPLPPGDGATAIDVIAVPIDEGRPPATDREIALGAVTMRKLGLSIGDTVPVTTLTSGETYEMTIVGTAIINDTFEASPGRGAAVTPGFMTESSPEASADPIVFELEPGADRDAMIRRAAALTDTPVFAPLEQTAVLNVGRIRRLPLLMATVIAVLAAASMAHALVLSIGRNRRTLGVLKGLGFTRRQVGGTVAVHATSFALVALVVALPLGVIVGRWGWRLVTRSLGVPDVAVVPLGAVGVMALTILVVTNLAAAYPAWRAARLSTAAALRSE